MKQKRKYIGHDFEEEQHTSDGRKRLRHTGQQIVSDWYHSFKYKDNIFILKDHKGIQKIFFPKNGTHSKWMSIINIVCHDHSVVLEISNVKRIVVILTNGKCSNELNFVWYDETHKRVWSAQNTYAVLDLDTMQFSNWKANYE